MATLLLRAPFAVPSSGRLRRSRTVALPPNASTFGRISWAPSVGITGVSLYANGILVAGAAALSVPGELAVQLVASNKLRLSLRGAVGSTLTLQLEAEDTGAADPLPGDGALAGPRGLVRDGAGTLWIANTGNHALRRVEPDGTLTTVVGNGRPGRADGPGLLARLSGPEGLASDGARIWIADTGTDRIRRVEGPT